MSTEADRGPGGDVHRSTLANHPAVGPVLPLFIGRLPGYVEQLKRGVEAGDWEGVRSLVHQLKGSGKSYGFAVISEQCVAIEKEIGSNGNAMPLVRVLVEYIEHIEGYGARPAL